VRLLQFGFTATDLDEAYMAFEGEKDDSPAVDKAPAAALTDDQLKRQRVNDEMDTRYKHKLGEFRRRIPSTLNAMGRVCVDKKAYTWDPGRSVPVLEPVAPDGKIYLMRFALSTTTPTGSGSGDATGRGPPFTASCLARLLHVMADGRTLAWRNLLAIPSDRDHLDREPVCPWADHFSPLFNDRTFRPAKATQCVNGIMASDVEGINPAELLAERAATALRYHFATFKSSYTQALSKFNESGQLDAMDFRNFAGGKTIVMYGHCYFQSDAGSVLAELATRLLPEDSQRVAGVASSGGARANDTVGRRKKRARADGVTEQNINLQGMNFFPVVDEASAV
jgi:hypothetical protein